MKLAKSLVIIALLALVVVAGCSKAGVGTNAGDSGSITSPTENSVVAQESGVSDADLEESEVLDEDLSFEDFDSFESDLDSIFW